MSKTSFSPGTVITSAWLNDVDARVNKHVINVAHAPYNAVGGDGTDQTAALQRAFDAARAQSGREVCVEIPAGNYNIRTLNLVGCDNVTIVCLGYVVFSGTSTVDAAMISIEGTERDSTSGLTIVGTLSLQAGTDRYRAGLYARWLVNSEIRIVVSGAFSVASVDVDVCFNNNFAWVWATNDTANAACILCGQDNVNINQWRVRCSGRGPDKGQVGMVVSGSGNQVFGDFSYLGTGLQLAAARGCNLTAYMELVGTGVAVSGINRAVNIMGGTYEVASNSAAFDFSGGTMQGANVIGARIVGTAGGQNRTAFKLGSASYFTNLVGYDIEHIEALYTGVLRGNTGGGVEQFIGATHHDANGVVRFLGATAAKDASTTVTGAAVVATDASVADHRYVYVATGADFTIAAPVRPTQWQRLTFRIVNATGAALGTIDWAPAFRLAPFTNPAAGHSRCITFRYEGSRWLEESRTMMDVPN
ncbi:MAG: hypothetical protein IPG50_05040 [Myxococcales bacterium]|nr:hypothetical protein [Myxococcales bacterium]